MPTPENIRSCRNALLFVLVCLFGTVACAQTTGGSKTSDVTSSVHAMHVLGLDGVKRGAHGTLTAQADGLNFQAGKAQGSLKIASIEDVLTSADSRQVGGKFLTLAKMGIPYSGGRVLSLFSHEKIDSLTLEYRDANGALHGAIFTMPLGQAAALKKDLVAFGAHTSVPIQPQPEKASAGGNQQ